MLSVIMLSVIMLSVIMLSVSLNVIILCVHYAECNYVECYCAKCCHDEHHYAMCLAECHHAVSTIMLGIVMLTVVMLSVVAPPFPPTLISKKCYLGRVTLDQKIRSFGAATFAQLGIISTWHFTNLPFYLWPFYQFDAVASLQHGKITKCLADKKANSQNEMESLIK